MNEQNTLVETKPEIKDVFTIVGDTLKLVWANKKDLVKICWKYVLAMVLIDIPFGLGLFFFLAYAAESQYDQLVGLAGWTLYISLILLLVAINILIGIFISMKFQIFFSELVNKGNKTDVSFSDLLKLHLKPYFVIISIGGLAMIGAMIPLLIPAAIIGVYITFALPAYFVDGKRGMSAFVQSYELARNRFWMIFGRTIVLNIALLGIFFGVAMVRGIVNLSIVFTSFILPGISLATIAVNSIFQIFNQLLMSAILSAFIILLYKNLKEVGPVIPLPQGQGEKLTKIFTWLGAIWLALIIIASVWGIMTMYGRYNSIEGGYGGYNQAPYTEVLDPVTNQ